MPPSLLIAPAAHGKTEHALQRIRGARATDRLSPVVVLLPGRTQVEAFRLRLVAQGDALGVRLFTFYELYAELLAQEGQMLPRLAGPAQARLIHRLIDELARHGRLPYYAPIVDKPGFSTTVRESIEELKRARVLPEAFAAAVRGNAQLERAELASPGPRLEELATIYSAYQGWLVEKGWVDPEGLGWLAAIAVEKNSNLGRDWCLLVVDGFDEFNPTQLVLLAQLAERAHEALITLTGGEHPRRAHRRFQRAREAITTAMPGLTVASLASAAPMPGDLRYLEQNVFEPVGASREPVSHLTFLEGQTRAVEARAALRWLKQRLVQDHIPLGEVALLARTLEPYRPFIEETAREFGLPVRLVGGVPLSENPAVSALLDLLALPAGRPAWRPRDLLAALRSPYFDWAAAGVDPAQAATLDAVSRQAHVQGGLDQWREALRWLAATAEYLDDDAEPGLAVTVSEAAAAQAAFEALVARLNPLASAPLSEYLAFVENLVGDDPTLPAAPFAGDRQARGSLGVVGQAIAAPATAARDVAALQSFKDVLRGLALTEAMLETGDQEWAYAGFIGALREAVLAANYQPQVEEQGYLFVASILEARGLSFRAVALLGLAEGEFPQAEREMPLLREADRVALRARQAWIEPHLRGDEISIFYEAVTRAREQLLVSRPYLADDGQAWEPSTYWRQLWRLMGQPTPMVVRPEDGVARAAVASPAEWIEQGYDLNAIARGAAVFQARQATLAAGLFEGELPGLAAELTARYPPDQSWSASRLEAYGTCGFYFFVAQALKLEPRAEPEEGYDARALGSMYHAILERLYSQVADPGDVTELQARLPGIAQAVFATAPKTYGFRPTALWLWQQSELVRILNDTVAALVETAAGWTPRYFEQRFGFGGAPLVIDTPNGPVQLHGFIDRIDVDQAGRLRLIDYKASGAPIVAADLQDGHRLQLPLYALGARDALQLGEVAEGFYWHIGQGRASSLKLEKFDGGVDGALEAAKRHVAAHVAGILAGQFQPRPPEKGCPNYCPAIGFCWRYTPRRW